MTGKQTVILVIAVIVICLIIIWFWLQHVIVKYDLDLAIHTLDQIIHTPTPTVPLFNII